MPAIPIKPAPSFRTLSRWRWSSHVWSRAQAPHFNLFLSCKKEKLKQGIAFDAQQEFFFFFKKNVRRKSFCSWWCCRCFHHSTEGKTWDSQYRNPEFSGLQTDSEEERERGRIKYAIFKEKWQDCRDDGLSDSIRIKHAQWQWVPLHDCRNSGHCLISLTRDHVNNLNWSGLSDISNDLREKLHWCTWISPQLSD